MRLPRGILAAVVAVVVLPSIMLVTLGIRLLDQDRALEQRRRIEIAEASLERTVSSIQKDFAALQRRLSSDLAWPPDNLAPDAVLLRKGVGRLLYLPSAPVLPEPPMEPFVESDRAEFQAADLAKALGISTRLAQSTSAAVRAGALLRIARLQRKSGHLEEALSAWSDLAAIHTVSIEGEPAGLMARRARCRALEQAGRVTELRKEASQLLSDLYAVRWPLDHGTFLAALQQARQWADRELAPSPEMRKPAEALSALWPRRKTEDGSLCHAGFTLIWHGDDALLAGPQYKASHWESPSGARLFW